MDTLPGAWRYRISTGSGWPDVGVLGLGEVESLICNFDLSVTDTVTGEVESLICNFYLSVTATVTG